MTKIEILIGISNSGKSTYSHQEWLKDPQNTVVINRDKIRELLFAYTEDSINSYYERKDIRYLEDKVSEYEDKLIQISLSNNKKVIIDATHLRMRYIRKYVSTNYPVDFKFFDITLEEAMERNSKRNRKVDIEIIKKQKEQYDSLRKNSLSEIQSMVNLGYPRIS